MSASHTHKNTTQGDRLMVVQRVHAPTRLGPYERQVIERYAGRGAGAFPVETIIRVGLAAIGAFIALCILSVAAAVQAEEPRHPARTLEAVRIEGTPPRIDGILDDAAWEAAPVNGGFLQKEPAEHEGESATETTTVRVLYDDMALYIGIECLDSEPQRIVANLSRRDADIENDWVAVCLDTHHDHRTSRWFAVAASGALADAEEDEGREPDRTWNGVWEARVSRSDAGWSAEYRIPYHVLRFAPQDEYTWGIQLLRGISRKKERDQWVLVRRNESGWVPRFGHLVGIRDIRPARHLEVVPFARASAERADASTSSGVDLGGAVGADVRYGVSSGTSLNVTLNPDFGQVEADPAVLNLTTFETFFEERRPFFIEGNGLFQPPRAGIVGIDSPYQLFYSRRIGRSPGMFDTPDGSDVIERPEATTILAAAKLSGKTARGTTFAVLDAVTQAEYAQIDSPVRDDAAGIERMERSSFQIEPFANYVVGRVQQDVLGSSNVALTVASASRIGAPPSLVVGADSTTRWGKNAYSLYARAASSRTGSLDDRKDGYGAQVYLAKFSGWLGGQLYADAHSPGFDVNDLGYMGRPDLLRVGAHVYAERQTPWLLARRSGYNVNFWSHWNYDGVNLARGVNVNNWNQLRFYGFGGWGVSRDFEAMDDRETRGGPLVIRPAETWGWLNLGSDWSKPLSAFVFFQYGQRDRNAGFRRRLGTYVSVRPAPNIELNFGPGFSRSGSDAQWITNVDSDGDGTDDRFIFGKLRSRTVDFTTRVNVSLTPNASLQAYVQPFVAVGDYGAVRELARPSSYDFRPYSGALKENPDFHARALRGNLVFRWEYQPGSAFYAVWSQSRSASFDGPDPALPGVREVGSAFTDGGGNVFLMKWDYWFGM
ncbi:carbohydrate binding family 9 domain-containing protein [Candidatus Poribacteria bacterium]|nr:carbohydrate binding family 9 domain-containing protein [Candidatus Poribacteria bacterium]